jgi:hypothetical protein
MDRPAKQKVQAFNFVHKVKITLLAPGTLRIHGLIIQSVHNQPHSRYPFISISITTIDGKARLVGD